MRTPWRAKNAAASSRKRAHVGPRSSPNTTTRRPGSCRRSRRGGSRSRRHRTAGPGNPATEQVPAAIGDPAELLDVDVEQLPGPLTDVADRDARRTVLVAQARQPAASQDVADGRARNADEGCQAVRPQAMSCRAARIASTCAWGRARGERWGRELRSSSPASPSASNRRSHFEAGGGSRRPCRPHGRRPSRQGGSDRRAAAGRASQLRPTMCHESLPTVVSWIPTPSLGRLSFVNNLFGNHS